MKMNAGQIAAMRVVLKAIATDLVNAAIMIGRAIKNGRQEDADLAKQAARNVVDTVVDVYENLD